MLLGTSSEFRLRLESASHRKSTGDRTRLYLIGRGNYHNLNMPFVHERSVKSVRATVERCLAALCRRAGVPKPEAFGPCRALDSMDRQIWTVTFDCIIPSRAFSYHWESPEEPDHDFLADSCRDEIFLRGV